MSYLQSKHFKLYKTGCRSLAVALLLLSVSQLTAAFELIPHKAVYSAKIKKGISISGTATRELVYQNGNWLYRFDVDSMAADIKEHVLADWDGQHLTPKEYAYSLSGFFIKDRNRSIQFNWPQNLATGVRNKNAWNLELSKGGLDSLGYQLQLAADIATGQKEMIYSIVRKGRVEPSLFAVVGEETIETVMGPSKAIVVKKVRAAEKKRETFLWFSVEKPLLLLKMTQKEQDGEEYEVRLKKLESYGS